MTTNPYGQSGPGQPGPPPSGHGQPPPGAPAYGTPQPGLPYGAPPVKRRSRLAPWFIAGAVALFLCCAGGIVAVLAIDTGDDSPSAAGADRDDTDDEGGDEGRDRGAAGIDDPVRDGKFEFVVTSIETGVETVGGDFLTETAQGQFILVHVTVENIGDKAQYFDGSSQALIDTEGREHSADSSAAIYIEDSDSFLNQINPGNKVDGIVVFDIPVDAVPATLRLHDSMFSGGVEVSVGSS